MRASLAVVLVTVGCSSPPPVIAEPTGSIEGNLTVGAEPDVSSVVLSLTGPTGRAAVASAAGTYRFEHLADGTYAITASAPSTSPNAVTVSVTVSGGSAATAPAIALTPVGTLAGHVTLGGATTGNAGTLVYLDGTGFSASTDDSGAWRIASLPVGSYTVRASHAGFQSAAAPPAQVQWRAERDAGALDLLPNLQFSGEIRGAVELVGLGPRAGVTVKMTGSSLITTSTDAGSYALAGVPEGVIGLDFASGPYRAHLPSVLSLPGGAGFLLASTGLAPLTSPALELQRGDRLDVPKDALTLLAPDQSRVVFFSRPSPGVCNLEMLTPQGPPLTRLASGVRCFATFTPDSQKLFFVTAASELFVMPAAGGTPTRLLGGFALLKISPSGRKVAVLSGASSLPGPATLDVYDLDTGQLTRLSSNSLSLGGEDLVWSKDDRRLLFTESAPSLYNEGRLTVGNTVTGATVALDATMYPGRARFRPDHDDAYLVSDEPTMPGTGLYQLKLAPLDGGPSRVLANRVVNGIDQVLASATGGELVYLGAAATPPYNSGTVTLLPLDGGSGRSFGVGPRVAPIPGGTHFNFALAAGTAIYDDYAMPFSGVGQPALLYTSVFLGFEKYTGDGQRVVLHAYSFPANPVTVMRIDGGSTTTLSSLAIGDIELSPDAGAVLFREVADGGSILKIADVETGVTRTLGPDVTQISSTTFSKNGVQLLWVNTRGELFTEPVAGGAAVRLSTAVASGFGYSLSFDGRRAQWVEVDSRSQSITMMLGDVMGSPPVVAMSHLLQQIPQAGVPRLVPSWFGSDTYLAPRGDSPEPYGAQDGWYLLPAQ